MARNVKLPQKYFIFAVSLILLSFFAGYKFNSGIDPRNTIKLRSIPGCLPEPASANGLKTYKNKTYDIEFQYDEGSKISYERINGEQYMNGALVEDKYKKIPIDQPSNVLVINNSELEFVDFDGSVNVADTQYFYMGFGDDPERGVCRINEDFEERTNSRGASYKWMAIKDPSLPLKGGRNEVTTYFACFQHGSRMWSLSASPMYSRNKDLVLKMFNIIVDSFEFID